MKSFKKWLEKKHSGVIPEPIHFKHVHKKHKKKKKFVKEDLAYDDVWGKDRPKPLITHPSVEEWKNVNDNSHLVHQREHPDREFRHEELRKKLTRNVEINPDQKKALSHYTEKSYYINEGLFSNSDFNNVDHLVKHKSTVEHLDSVIQNNTAPYDYHVYSGLGFNPHDHMKEGKMFSPAYISATTDKGIAKSFAFHKSYDDEDKHIMHLHIKKGDPALHLPNETGENQVTFAPHEFETIIGRNTTLKHIKTETMDAATNHNSKLHIHHFEIEK